MKVSSTMPDKYPASATVKAAVVQLLTFAVRSHAEIHDVTGWDIKLP